MMNFRNKYAIITIRSLLGLALIALGLMGLFMGVPKDQLSEAGAASIQGLEALGIIKLIAVVELVAGVLLITGYAPAFGNLLFAPIVVAINAYHIAKEPSSMAGGVIFGLLTAYLGYAYWDQYKPLFERKKQ